MTPIELLPPGEAVHGNEKWMQLRGQGVTASEIAAVMGLSRWGSPFSLYWQKANGWQGEDSPIAAAGRHLEDAIADWWLSECDPIENLVGCPAGLYAHPDRPWQLATPDRLLRLSDCVGCDGSGSYDSGHLRFECTECDGRGGLLAALLECKWAAYSWDGWGEPGTDEVPVAYRAQALWQLDVMGVDEVHFAALGPGGFRAYRVRRDEGDLELMRAAGEDFMRRLREQDPPDLDSHTATLGALKRLHPEVGEGDVEVGADLTGAYAAARLARKCADERLALAEAEIRAALGSTYGRAVYNGKTVASRSVFEQRRIDSARLRTERPEIAEAYTTITTVDKLTPGRASHGS